MPTPRHVNHDIVPPLIDEKSHTLILGTILSPKSEAAAFYYAHPQNRFWKIMSSLFDCSECDTTEQRIELAMSNGIALWDVIHSCDIIGASDSTIKNVVYNDIIGLLSMYPNITRIFATGNKAYDLLKKYPNASVNKIIINAEKLPSPSPLNCAMSLEKLVSAYSVIKTTARP